MKPRKAIGLVVLAALMLSAAALAYSASGKASTSGGPSGTITFWARESDQLLIPKLITAYQKTHPNVKVKLTIIPNANFVQKFGTSVAAGSGPDVTSVDLVYVPYFASVGALKDITSVYNALPYRKTLSPGHVAQAQYKGKFYALPFTAEASVLYYNKALFKQAGLNPNRGPATYAEMEADAKKIRALGSDVYGFGFAGQCGGCNIFEFAPHIWASGGNVLSKDGKKALLDSSQVTDALNFYHQMYADGVMPSWVQNDGGSGQVPAFASGKLGMINIGAFALPTIQQAHISLGVGLIPGKTGGVASFAGGDEIAIPAHSKNPTAAADFLKWTTGASAQSIIAHLGSIPIRTDLATKIYAKFGPAQAVLAHAMSLGRVPYSVVENAIFNDNNGPWAKMINQAVFTGNVKQAQSTAQSAAQQLINNGG